MPKPLLPEFLARLAGTRLLPETLPDSPFPMFQSWFDEEVAARRVPNPSAMTLATIGEGGTPRARVVLCRGIDAGRGFITFFTNYEGAKGRELLAGGVAGAVFHWDHSERQVRIEGPVTKSPAEESDAYFAARPWESRISAWASRQSRPLESRAELLARVGEVMEELKLDPAEFLARGNAASVPRPPHWGGFRIHASRVELWLGGPGRLHDRAVWERGVRVQRSAGATNVEAERPWRSTRLQP
jgi:pyridoxamine 5'-phosphate oxidase